LNLLYLALIIISQTALKKHSIFEKIYFKNLLRNSKSSLYTGRVILTWMYSTMMFENIEFILLYLPDRNIPFFLSIVETASVFKHENKFNTYSDVPVQCKGISK
jgi:hypothetical protein